MTDDNELNQVFMREPLDHDGHANCVLAMFPDLYRHATTAGWLVYGGGYWSREGAEQSLKRAITQTLRRRIQIIKAAIEDPKDSKSMLAMCKVTAQQVTSIITLMKSMKDVDTSGGLLDGNYLLFNCKNGVINLETGELLPHSPHYLFTHRTETNYKPDADCTVWDKFLLSLGWGVDKMTYAQRMVGYSMTGLTDEEKMFYLYGVTRAGKGTMTNALLGIMGKYGQGINFRTFTVRRDGDTQNFDLAAIANKRFLAASESERNERINASVFKQVTGGDPIFAALKGKDGASFFPQWTVLLSSNYPMNADPMDNAIWARVRVLKFDRSMLGKEDKGLKRKLGTESAQEAILAWGVRGSAAYFDQGLGECEQITTDTNRMRLEASSVLVFIDETCKLEVGTRSEGKALYAAYVEWALGEGWKPYGRKAFTQAMEQIGCTVSVQRNEVATTRYYTNVTFAGENAGDSSLTKRINMGVDLGINL